jgi:hypothetical protein
MHADIGKPLVARGPVKPWEQQHPALVLFVTDNGELYGSQQHAVSVASFGPTQLMVNAPPHGVVTITGPCARELCLDVCAGRATLIQADGKDLTSVIIQLTPEAQAAKTAAQLRATP